MKYCEYAPTAFFVTLSSGWLTFWRLTISPNTILSILSLFQKLLLKRGTFIVQANLNNQEKAWPE